jgi:hypothetical protein
MKKSVSRIIGVGVALLSCTPFIYLACAIKAFRQDSTRIDPCFEGVVDYLESRAGRPLELLFKANGVRVAKSLVRQVRETSCRITFGRHQPDSRGQNAMC